MKRLQKFVEKNADTNESPSPTDPLRCIDDRDPRPVKDPRDPLPPFAIPGAGLGLVFGVLSGTRNFEKIMQAQTALLPDAIVQAVETVI